MGKRIRVALAVMFVVLVGLIGWQMAQPREPMYQGKPLSFWLKDYARLVFRVPLSTNATASVMVKEQEEYIRKQLTGREELDGAVRQIGTNAIPTLLRLLRLKDSALKLKLLALAQGQHIFRIQFTSAESWNEAASTGFQLLGNKAHSAVPALIQIADDKISSPSQRCALVSLAAIGDGDETVPTLLRYATNADARLSFLVTTMLRARFPEAAAKAGIK
jgi:hypothetical protein